MSTFYLIATVTGCFFILLLCVIVMLIKNRKKPRRPLDLFVYKEYDSRKSSKSAPISRSVTPTKERHSYAHVYGSVDDSIIRAATFDSLPDFETEKVQPEADGEKSKSMTSLQYQSHILEMHQQMSFKSCDIESMVDESLPPSPHGRVYFKTFFDESQSKLTVTLLHVRGLKGRDKSENFRDPFVRIFLLPDEHTCHTSKTMKTTLDPIYSESYSFIIGVNEIKQRSLRFTVYDVDKRRLRHTLGHVIVSLRDIDLTSSEVICREMETSLHHGPSVGEINLALSYLPQMERLKIVILRAKHVRPPSDPDAGFYVRLHLLYGNKIAKIKQTMTHAAGKELNFKESFAFSTSNKAIENFSFIVALVQSRDATAENDIEIGQVTLGSFTHARGAGLIHWQEMLSNSKSVVTKWHQLNVPV
ncbi:calcium ion-regulated exocytosis of neurotransmitter [Mactra antiquata]